MRSAARLPEKQMAVGVEWAAHNCQIHAWESFAGTGLLRARRSRTVHQQIGVVDQSAVAGPNFNGANPSASGDSGRQDEVPVDVQAGRGQRVGTWRFDHQIWRAELPIVVEV